MPERFTIPRQCKRCGRDFIGRDKAGVIAKYCSRGCHLRTIGNNEQRSRAGKIGALKAIAKRGTGTKGYIKEYGRHQHRVVMEKHLGRYLTSDEIIHHIDENKHNNSIENLQIVTRQEHARIHFTTTSKKDTGGKS